MRMFGPRYPVLKEGIVNLKDGKTSFRAVIWGRRGGYLVLRNVTMLRPRQESVQVDGEVAVLERDVLFIQVVS